MILDLDGWLKIASILVTLLLWIITNSKRARLEAFFIHATSHPIPGAKNQQVNTHALVVRNAGTKPAINLRVVHNVMPESIRVWPTVNYTVNNLPLGGELLFPALVPREQITISYLYAPPLTYDQIGALVKSDDGLAQVLP